MDKNYFRNNSYLSRYTVGKPRTGSRKVNKSFVNTIANQFIICAALCLAVIVLSNFTNPFIVRFMDGVKWVVGEDYDFMAASTAVKGFIPGFGSNLDDNPEVSEGLPGNTDAVETSSSGMYGMIIPVEGEITSGFGMREDPITKENTGHMGIDIDGEVGTPIMAAMDGVVLKIEESGTLGKSVRIMHGNGLETLYGHCSEILVKENQPVKRGDFIAKVGDTGVVTSAHLHFEVIEDGEQIDPMSVIEGVVEAK